MSAAATFIRLTDRALIAVGGPDWRDFLQNLLSQDVVTLASGEIRFGALLTPQGRLLYDLFIVGRETGCWLDVAAEHREALIGRLGLYRLRSKVELSPDETSVAALIGGDAPVVGWIRDPRLPELGWRGYGVEAPRGAALGDMVAYEAHRLRLGAPGSADWGSDRFYPIEADFDLLNGIDFKKGCFVGQEITSRMKRRGPVKNRMLPIVFEGPVPAPGTEVLAGELRAGEVTSAACGRGMALLRLDRIEAAALTIAGRRAKVERPTWFAERT